MACGPVGGVGAGAEVVVGGGAVVVQAAGHAVACNWKDGRIKVARRFYLLACWKPAKSIHMHYANIKY